MELVYLWVEGYKNIKKQGFNFSPRFTCEYDEEKNELTITKTKDYESIFPDNINISAIVGENGSGKSSIIDELLNIQSRRVLIYKDKKTLYINNTADVKITTDMKYENFKYINKDIFVYLNYDVLKTSNVIDWSSYTNQNTYYSNEYIKHLKMEDLKDKKNWYKYDLEIFNKKIISLIFKTFKNNHNPVFNFFPKSIMISFHKEQLKDKSNELITYFQNIEKPKDSEYSMKDFYEKYYRNHEDLFLEAFKIGAIGLAIYDNLKRNIFHLSLGERKIFIDFLLINDSLKSKKNDVLIILDEPDVTLHPMWQKKYIYELIKTFSKVDKKIHFIITSHSPFLLSDLPKENVIFLEKDKETGYCKNVTKEVDINPFGANIHTLLSHGFFVQDGLMGEFAKEKINLAIAYLNKKKLSIKEINYCENIIPIIGEPIIKNQLQKMLDSKQLSKIDKIDELEAELEIIKHRIESIRKNQ